MLRPFTRFSALLLLPILLCEGEPPGTPAPATITLPEALALAEKYNPRLSVALAGVDVARAGILVAKTRPNPDVNYMGGHQNLRLPSGASGLLQHWGAAQPLELPSIRRTRLTAAELGRESSERALEETRLQLRAAVKQAFYQVLRRQGEIALAKETLKLVEDLRQKMQVRVDTGEAGRLELTRAESEVAGAQTFLRSAQLRETAALAELRALISAPLNPDVTLNGKLDAAVNLENFEQLKEKTLRRHPALARADAEVRRARARLTAEKALRTPQPTAIIEYEQMPDLRFVRAGISIPVPFFNRRQGPIAEAVATVTQSEAQVSALRLELTSELEQAYETYALASQQVNSFDAGVLRGAQASVDAAEAAFRFGERGIIDVLDSQRVLRSVRLDYLNAQYDRQAALIELELLRAIEIGEN